MTWGDPAAHTPPQSTRPQASLWVPGVEPGRVVQVYRNLTRACWSVRAGGRVLAHVPALYLTDCRMVVQPAGQARARAEGQRNVHAYIRGTVSARPPEACSVRARYNVFRAPTFTTEGGPVSETDAAHFDEYGQLWIRAES